MLFMVMSTTSRQNKLFFAKIGQNCQNSLSPPLEKVINLPFCVRVECTL
nr:MAG TPA: hypothetical protein [Caudoviricetes sp.]